MTTDAASPPESQENLARNKQQTESCDACGKPRFPRYKTDKSWAKHKQFCTPQDAASQSNHVARCEAPPAKRICISPEAAGAAAAKGGGGGTAATVRSPSLDELPQLVQSLKQQLEGIEFNAVQLGVTLGKAGIARDVAARLVSSSGTTTDHIGEGSVQQLAKESVSKRLREEFLKMFPATVIASHNPDLKLLLDLSLWQFEKPTPTAILLQGRYRKLVRGIPQTRWPCADCRNQKTGRYGKRHAGEEGMEQTAPLAQETCKACKGSGLQYPHSVQDLIGHTLVKAFNAEDCVFHGMGREDIDVRCLGSGRPFVLELKAPTRRSATEELEALTATVNTAADGRVELCGPLQLSGHAEPARLKGLSPDKTYTVRFRVAGSFRRPEDEALILALEGRELDQRTPVRVEQRRADLVRGRRVISLGPLVADGDELELTIKAASGTYIKEFVHGDDGRTVPSVSSVLGRRCEVLWLDVCEIHA